jgi:ferric-dicitrate binding protein FerR (iron transport regulator)
MTGIEDIIRLITGNVSGDRKAEIITRVKEDKQLRKDFASVKNAWALSSSQSGMPESQVENSYRTLREKMHPQKTIFTVRLYLWTKYAAVLFIVFGAGILSHKYISSVKSDRLAVNHTPTEIVVPAGQTAEVNLPDGSHVWLNAGSSLVFPVSFNNSERDVHLKGEAFFQVKKGKIPFIVSTKYGDVKVLGTSFNVCAFDDSQFQTTLEEGVVQFTGKARNQKVTLEPGQQVCVAENGQMQVRQVETNRVTSWRSGVIVFEKEPLRSVIQKLERHFAITINLEDKTIGDIRFTGSIENETLFEVLEYINMTKPIQYSYDKKLKQLTIKAK